MDFKEVFVESSYPHTLRIPNEWVFTELSEAINVIGGSQPPKSEFSSEPKEGFVRLIQIRDYKSDQHKVFIPKDKARRFVKPDDVMIGRYGPPIFQILKGLEGAYNVALMKAEPVAGVMDNQYLYFYLQNRDIYNYVEAASDRTAGQSGVNKEHLEKYPVGLPPLAEQKIIADKLDTLLAQVETTKARLERIPEILKSFRQSVLAAAVSGKLSEEWRKDNVLQTVTLVHNKKLPTLENSEQYSVSVTSWVWARFGSIVDLINGDRGKNYPNQSEYVDVGIPFINTGHIDPNGTLSDERMNYITKEKYDILGSGKTKSNDLVYCLRGATMGKTARVHYDVGAIASSLVIVRPRPEIERDFAYYFLISPQSKKLITEFDNGSAQPNLSAKSLACYPIQLPPKVEQTEIVRRVAELFTFADSIEQKANAALARVNNLTQSILAKAFRGELTAEWRAANPELISGDNSAAALLERIKAERAVLAPSKKSRASKKS